jgi:hypothetical protein
MQDDEFLKEVQCKDTFGRPRVLRVFVTGAGDIVFQAPPGEVAQLAPSMINEFQAVITEAHIAAMKAR